MLLLYPTCERLAERMSTRLYRFLHSKIQSTKQRMTEVGRRVEHWIDGGPEGPVLLLLTNPRSGSTWLLDMLRCHPDISMYPRYWLYQELGLGGRRYPRDLSRVSGNAREIEVSPGVWENIPRMDAALPKEDGAVTVSIEKIHPHFFDHEVRSFVEKVSSLSRRRDVKLIYQVRDPKETLVSFLEYKRRNPDWDHRRLEAIPTHLRCIYESILEVAQSISGLVVEYGTLTANVEDELGRAVRFATGGELSREDLRAIRDETSRDKKESAETSFVGTKRSGTLVDDYGSYFSAHSDEVERCYAAYDAICSST